MDLTKALKLNETVRIDDEINGEKYWFEVKKHALTPEFRQQVADLDNRPIEIAHAMADVVVAWDLEIDEKPILPDFSTFKRTPQPFINHMLSKIGACWSGNELAPDE